MAIFYSLSFKTNHWNVTNADTYVGIVVVHRISTDIHQEWATPKIKTCILPINC